VSVELDALPIEVLRARLVTEVEARFNMEALRAVREREDVERVRLVRALEAIR
jgi:hypothetical protein